MLRRNHFREDEEDNTLQPLDQSEKFDMIHYFNSTQKKAMSALVNDITAGRITSIMSLLNMGGSAFNDDEARALVSTAVLENTSTEDGKAAMGIIFACCAPIMKGLYAKNNKFYKSYDDNKDLDNDEVYNSFIIECYIKFVTKVIPNFDIDKVSESANCLSAIAGQYRNWLQFNLNREYKADSSLHGLTKSKDYYYDDEMDDIKAKKAAAKKAAEEAGFDVKRGREFELSDTNGTSNVMFSRFGSTSSAGKDGDDVSADDALSLAADDFAGKTSLEDDAIEDMSRSTLGDYCEQWNEVCHDPRIADVKNDNAKARLLASMIKFAVTHPHENLTMANIQDKIDAAKVPLKVVDKKGNVSYKTLKKVSYYIKGEGTRDTSNSLVGVCEEYKFDIVAFASEIVAEARYRKIDPGELCDEILPGAFGGKSYLFERLMRLRAEYFLREAKKIIMQRLR